MTRNIVGTSLILLAVTACFEVTQEVWVNADGTGRVRLELGIAESLLALTRDLGSEDPVDSLRAQYAAARTEIEADENVTSFNFSEHSDSGVHFFVFDLNVKDVRQLGETYERLGESQTDRGQQLGMQGDWPIQIESTSKGQLRFHQVVAAGPAETAESAAEADPFQAMGKAFAISMFGDKYATFRLHAPEIVETNGQLSDDGRTVTWRYSLAEIASEPNFRRDMSAVVARPSNRFSMIVLAGIIIVLAAIAIGLVLRSRQREKGKRHGAV